MQVSSGGKDALQALVRQKERATTAGAYEFVVLTNLLRPAAELAAPLRALHQVDSPLFNIWVPADSLQQMDKQLRSAYVPDGLQEAEGFLRRATRPVLGVGPECRIVWIPRDPATGHPRWASAA